ncbi:MAG: VWA domain-containing protein [Acidobacteria bacterium]|nr:VWA domain-containing protein [Acidobacteriota bacterium]
MIWLATTLTQAQTNVQQPPNVEQQIVKLNVLVTDASKHPVADVRQEEFRVFENNVPQTISFFSKEELPLLYGIAIDNSGSFRSVIQPVINAAKAIINQNKPGDETLLIRFIDSEKVETVKDFTSDKEVLSKALDSLYIEGGQTALIDAVYLTAQRLSKYKKDDGVNRRRAIILMTDGEERGSYYKKDQLFELLRKENIQIFIVAIVNVLSDEGGQIRLSPREQATNFVNSLAKESGGFAFFPKSKTELQNIADQLMLYLRTQYIIGYVPTGQKGQKPLHKVDVKLADAPERKKQTVATRPGYIVSPK